MPSGRSPPPGFKIGIIGIGSHTCKALRHAGFDPITYDNLARGNPESVKGVHSKSAIWRTKCVCGKRLRAIVLPP
jgi:UDP-glucose 4-epimerase